MNKFVDINALNSKQKLLFLALCLILLIVITSILTSLNLKKDNVIDYKNDDIYDIIVDAKETNDRDIYWTLNKIILEFLYSYQTVEKMDTSMLIEYHYTGYSLEDYYKTLDPDYKKFLGKKKFIESSKEVMSKMVTTNENGFVLKSEDIIKYVYKMNGYDGYICQLNTVDENEEAYIGIILDKEKNQYNIFYIK